MLSFITEMKLFTAGVFTEWRLPSQTVIIEDNLTREVLTPALLKKYLGVSLLHEDVRSILSDSMRNSLGIKTISTDHLIEVGPAIVNDLKNAVASKNSGKSQFCCITAYWIKN